MGYLQYIMFLILLLGSVDFLWAQEERARAREGNDAYEAEKYDEAEINYRKSLEEASSFVTAQFNLGDALYRQERYDEAAKQFELAAGNAQEKSLRAKAYHNLGNAHLKNNQLDKSIEAYKKALRLNPQDEDTRYNLSYALKLKKEQQKNQQQNQQNQDRKQDQKDQHQQQDKQDKNNQEQQKNQEREQKEGDQKNEEKDQKKEQNGDQKQQKPQEQQPQPGDEQDARKQQLSREEAMRLLEALENEEAEVQKKILLKKSKGKKSRSDKDW